MFYYICAVTGQILTVKNIHVILTELSVGQAARQYFFLPVKLTGNFLMSC